MQSVLEKKMAKALLKAGVPPHETEFRFHPVRQWRFDFAWPEHRVALEVEGGVWNSGRHTRGSGFIGDCEKYNAAAVLGWRVLRVTSSHIPEQAVDWVTRCLGTS